MTISELIGKLTEMEKCVGGNTEVSVLNDSSVQYTDWLGISDIHVVEGNEEEMTDSYVYLVGIAESEV